MGKKFGVALNPDGNKAKEIQNEQRMSMKNSMGKNKWLSELNTDLFADYGFGIQAWIRMLLNLFLLYAILSIGAIGIMMLYKDHHGLSQDESMGFFAQANKYTLGNIGFAQSLCYF